MFGSQLQVCSVYSHLWHCHWCHHVVIVSCGLGTHRAHPWHQCLPVRLGRCPTAPRVGPEEKGDGLVQEESAGVPCHQTRHGLANKTIRGHRYAKPFLFIYLFLLIRRCRCILYEKSESKKSVICSYSFIVIYKQNV